MSFGGPKINWVMDSYGLACETDRVAYELADTADAYRATGVSPSIGSWGRSVRVDPPTPLEAAMAEIELEIPRVVIDPPIQDIRPRGKWFWGEGGFQEWRKIKNCAATVLSVLYTTWMMGWWG